MDKLRKNNLIRNFLTNLFNGVGKFVSLSLNLCRCHHKLHKYSYWSSTNSDCHGGLWPVKSIHIGWAQFSADLSWNSFFFVIFSARYFIPSSVCSIWHHFSLHCMHYTIYHFSTMCVFSCENVGCYHLLLMPLGPTPLTQTRSQGKYTTTLWQLHRLTVDLTRLFCDIFALSFIQND